MKKTLIFLLVVAISLIAYSYFRQWQEMDRGQEQELKNLGEVVFVPKSLPDSPKIGSKTFTKLEFIAKKKALADKMAKNKLTFNETQEWTEVANQEIMRCTGGKIENIDGNLIEKINEIINNGC